jgi:hypothetical protein
VRAMPPLLLGCTKIPGCLPQPAAAAAGRLAACGQQGPLLWTVPCPSVTLQVEAEVRKARDAGLLPHLVPGYSGKKTGSVSLVADSCAVQRDVLDDLPNGCEGSEFTALLSTREQEVGRGWGPRDASPGLFMGLPELQLHAQTPPLPPFKHRHASSVFRPSSAPPHPTPCTSHSPPRPITSPACRSWPICCTSRTWSWTT